MWTSREISRKASPWSKFRFISDDRRRWALQIKISLTSRALNVPILAPNLRERLELISELSLRGLSDRQISDYLNARNIISPRGVPYTPKLIWVTLKKYNARKRRLSDTQIYLNEVTPVILVTQNEYERLRESPPVVTEDQQLLCLPQRP